MEEARTTAQETKSRRTFILASISGSQNGRFAIITKIMVGLRFEDGTCAGERAVDPD
jgi:hypothetical protein